MLLFELGEKIVRVVLPRSVTCRIALSSSAASLGRLLQVGRVVHVGGQLETSATRRGVPVAEHVEFLDLH